MKQKRPAAIKILFEDNHLLVVEKPVNVPSQADETGDPDLLSLLKEDLKIRYLKPGKVYLGLVHRLDRPAGGVMVFAKTSKAASRLGEQMQSGVFQKTYMAVVHGVPLPEGHLEHYLKKDSKTNMVKVVPSMEEGAKKALLEYTVKGVYRNAESANESSLSLVRINLLTGRSHQIRVQFSVIGCPLFGDQRYGAIINRPGQQLALWSTEIHCIHPVKKEEMDFSCLPPVVFPWNQFELS